MEVLKVLLPDLGKSELLHHFLGLASEVGKEGVLDEAEALHFREDWFRARAED